MIFIRLLRLVSVFVFCADWFSHVVRVFVRPFAVSLACDHRIDGTRSHVVVVVRVILCVVAHMISVCDAVVELCLLGRCCFVRVEDVVCDVDST